MKKKDEGFVEYVLALMIILMAVLLIVYGMSMRKINLQKQEIEDGIASSALAAAIIDLNEYGTYKYIRSNNGRGTGYLAGSDNRWGSAEDNLLNIFRENLAENLNLDPNTLVANEDSIIDGEVKIVHFWIYNKELKESRDEHNQPIMIKDYRGRWIKQHEETDNYYIYKYDSTSVGGWNKSTVQAVKEADGKVYTPRDDKMIVIGDAIDGEGNDGAGKGRVEVDSMTIYATIEFYIKPFGQGMEKDYEVAYNDDGGVAKTKTVKGWEIWDGSKYEPDANSWEYHKVEDSNINTVNKIKIVKSVVVDVQPVEDTP